MKLRIIPGLAALASLTLFSCYPMPEPEQQRVQPSQSLTSPEQQRLAQQRENLKRQADAQNSTDQRTENPVTDPGSTTTTTNTQKPANEPKRDYPFAATVPGKEGFVFSPYNNKVIDVRDMPTGTLVQDPTYPAAEKKYFRVP